MNSKRIPVRRSYIVAAFAMFTLFALFTLCSVLLRTSSYCLCTGTDPTTEQNDELLKNWILAREEVIPRTVSVQRVQKADGMHIELSFFLQGGFTRGSFFTELDKRSAELGYLEEGQKFPDCDPRY